MVYYLGGEVCRREKYLTDSFIAWLLNTFLNKRDQISSEKRLIPARLVLPCTTCSKYKVKMGEKLSSVVSQVTLPRFGPGYNNQLKGVFHWENLGESEHLGMMSGEHTGKLSTK